MNSSSNQAHKIIKLSCSLKRSGCFQL